ncbi:MAG: hypothetical protein RIE31_03880 [Alphaproteobacteria bacterium]
MIYPTTTRTALIHILFVAMLLALPLAEGKSNEGVGRWAVLSDEVNGERACWVAAEPAASENPDNVDRLFPMFMVAFYPERNIQNEMTFNAGFSLAPDQRIELVAGARTYTLSPSGAWALVGLSPNRIDIDKLTADSTFTVKLRSLAGSVVVDRFDTTGLRQALIEAARQCEVSLSLLP